MARSRKKTFPAIARLSTIAREIIEQAFLQGPGVRSVQSIVGEVEKKTGEKVDDNAVYRYHDYWSSEERPFIEARREAEGMLAALKNNPAGDFEELVTQRLVIAQVLNAKRLDESDPVELGYLANSSKRVEIQRERNRLLRERTGNDSRKIKVLERSLELKEKAFDRVKASAEKVKGALANGASPDKVAKMVDQILGL